LVGAVELVAPAGPVVDWPVAAGPVVEAPEGPVVVSPAGPVVVAPEGPVVVGPDSTVPALSVNGSVSVEGYVGTSSWPTTTEVTPALRSSAKAPALSEVDAT
jgi:hypothetical protein